MSAAGPGGEPHATALLLHPDCGRHDTGWGHPEHQGRLPAVVHALYRETPQFLDLVLQQEGRHATEEQLLRVHAAAHLERVRAAVAEAETTSRIVELDADTKVSASSWDAALAAAGCVIDAAALVLTGQARSAMALSRPPGHHATPSVPMGFCLFNSVAVAVRAAQTEHGVRRVLIIDWDVHHGNGTQDIFYEDRDVYFLSLHLENHWPGTGHAAERGAGAGQGTTLNVPIPAGTPPAVYHARFEAAVAEAFAAARPEIVFVSAGYDCLAGDPLGGMLLEPADLHAMTRLVLLHAGEVGARGVVAALEGGYVPERVGAGVLATMRALAGLPVTAPHPPHGTGSSIDGATHGKLLPR
ncbi:MAG: histone deacetylase [Gemmatimonadota bacterium]